MRRMLLLSAAVLAWTVHAGPAGAQWGDAPVADDRRARCPAIAGHGWIAALNAGARELTLRRTGPDGGAQRRARTRSRAGRPPAPRCRSPWTGSSLVAAVVERRGRQQLVIARRLAEAGAFGLAARARVPSGAGIAVVAAAGPGGAGVVAWAEQKVGVAGSRVAVRSARFAAGVDAAPPPEELLPPTAVEDNFVDPVIAAGADAVGALTVAWTTPRPPKRNGRVSGLAAVDVAEAPPGSPFGAPQRLSEDRQDVQDIALAVAGDGRALLAHDGTGGVEVFERAPRGRFAAVARYGGGEGRCAARRDQAGGRAGGRRQRRGRVAGIPPDRRRHAARHERVRSAGERGGGRRRRRARHRGPHPRRPGGFERDESTLDAAIAPDGSAVLAWLAAPAVPGAPYAAGVATSTGGAFSAPIAIGGVVRDVRTVAPLVDAAGPAVLWSDDRAPTFFTAQRSPRLHLARPERPLADPPPPSVRVTGHRHALFPGQALRLTLRCSASCEVRARVPARRRTGLPDVAVGGRDGAGPVTLRIRPMSEPRIARRSGRLPVVLDAAAPGGSRAAHGTVRLQRRRAPAPALPPAARRASAATRERRRRRLAHRRPGAADGVPRRDRADAQGQPRVAHRRRPRPRTRALPLPPAPAGRAREPAPCRDLRRTGPPLGPAGRADPLSAVRLSGARA